MFGYVFFCTFGTLLHLLPMVPLFPADILNQSVVCPETKSCYVAHGWLQGYRTKGVDNFDIVSEKKRVVAWNNVKVVVYAQQEQQGAERCLGLHRQ